MLTSREGGRPAPATPLWARTGEISGGGVALKDIILRTVSFAVGSGKGINQNASILQPTVAILDE